MELDFFQKISREHPTKACWIESDGVVVDRVGWFPWPKLKPEPKPESVALPHLEDPTD